MLVKSKEIQNYLDDYHNGRIAEGLPIGCELDDYLRFKKGSFNIILGHDNVGKTYWRVWYYLVLSVKYDLKWCIWTGENKAGQIVRNLIQIYTGKQFKELSISEVYRYQQEIEQWFTFVDNSKFYKYKDLLDIFNDDYNGCLIDPYTGLDRKYGHADNYDFLNTTRQWVNDKGITIDVCTHPVSASGRAQGYYPKGHDWEGHLKNPYKADTEGGKPFANRCDDFIVLHRLVKHDHFKTVTFVYVDKIKDIETGGQITKHEFPVQCAFNKGLGFKVEGIDPLRENWIKGTGYEPKPLKPLGDEFEQRRNEQEDLPF